MSDIQAIRERQKRREESRLKPGGMLMREGHQAHIDCATLLSALTAANARAEAAEARVGELEEPAAFARFVLRWLFHKEAENPKQFRELVINHPHAQAEACTLKGTPDGR